MRALQRLFLLALIAVIPLAVVSWLVLTSFRDPPHAQYHTESPVGKEGALMVISVDGAIIPDHNDVFTSPFIDFLSRVINSVVFGRQGS